MRRSTFQPAFVVWGATIGLLGIGIITPQGRALIEANAGTLGQTQAELSVYRWPEIPTQDALRRPGSADLTGTMQLYEAALALDPANVTANRRLGQIELARGLYDVACRHFSAAFAANPHQRATRQLSGECAVFSGENEQAIALWRSIDMSEGQLMARQWWYDSYLAAHDKAQQLKQAADAWTMRVLLDSNSTPTDRSQTETGRLAQPK
jgi:tetratricopeptide (TPR) repeat protein